MNFSKKNHEHKNNIKNVVSENLRVTTTIMAMAFVGLTAMSCKDGNKEESSATTDTEMIKLEPSTSTAKKRVQGSKPRVRKSIGRLHDP